MSADAFPHAERAVTAKLGITPKDLRGIRTASLTRGDDWEVVGNSVHYSSAGLGRLATLLKVPVDGAATAQPEPEKISTEPGAGPAAEPPLLEEADPAPTPAASGGPAGRAAGAIEDLVCLKCYRPNRQIVEARTGAGEEVLVRVRDNTNLRPGMTMKCRFAGTRIWELAQRLPRRRGKW